MLNRFRILLALPLLALLTAAPLHAQTVNRLNVSGSSSGTGIIKRTIIDITKPSGRVGLPTPQSTQNTTFYIIAPIPPGLTANQIATVYHDSAAAVILHLGLGPNYAISPLSNAGATFSCNLVKFVGSYTVTDSIIVPGATITSQYITASGSPVGSAVSPWSLAALAALMAWAIVALRRRGLPRPE